MEQAHSVVCICETHGQAQRAMYNLRSAGIDLEALSLATRDVSSDVHDVDTYNVGDQTFTIPGIGHLLVSGPLASWIDTAFSDGRDGGVSIVGAGLAARSISRNSILEYEAALRADKSLLIVGGSTDAVAAAVKVIGEATHRSPTIDAEKAFDTVHGATVLETSTYTHQAR